MLVVVVGVGLGVVFVYLMVKLYNVFKVVYVIGWNLLEFIGRDYVDEKIGKWMGMY